MGSCNRRGYWPPLAVEPTARSRFDELCSINNLLNRRDVTDSPAPPFSFPTVSCHLANAGLQHNVFLSMSCLAHHLKLTRDAQKR